MPTLRTIEPNFKIDIKKNLPNAMLGNEAIGIGLIDAGITFVTSYPGTPSIEIMDKLREYNNTGAIKANWSTNEAVALQEAIASSILGIDSAFVCKSVGINVAMDALLTIANSGTNGALLIIIADDPNMLSSQNEQDNRNLAFFANLPIFEPSSVQECYSLPKEAVNLSRKFKIPVIIRTVTRISHALGVVKRGNGMPLPMIEYKIDRDRFVNIPVNARENHQRILEVHKQLDQFVSIKRYWSELQIGAIQNIVYISSGSSVNYLIDALELLELDGIVFCPKLIHPFPKSKLIDLAKKYKKIIVVEELEPYLEINVRSIIQEAKLSVEIIGKTELNIPRSGELTVDIIVQALSKKFNIRYEPQKYLPISALNLLIDRPPVLCAGCPHRSTYVLINEILKRFNPIYCNDIGCYSLGVLPPHNTADMLICMGASIPMATSIAQTKEGNLPVAIIGDSTFWHTGLSGLANAIWKEVDILIVIMDNYSTAMTGNQENPSVKKKLDILKTVDAMGAKCRKINPMEYKQSKIILKELLKETGVKVLLSQYPCALTSSMNPFENPTVALIKVEMCNGCGYCVEKIACPAFSFDSERKLPIIDNDRCNGCMYCSDHCHHHAIKEVVRK